MTITLAIDRYDRLMPFHDGSVEVPAGLDLKVFQIGQETHLRDGANRHVRMLQNGEFDAAEVSLSSYIAACARGLPFTAIPVFPRRLFSLGQVFVRRDSIYSHPRELNGRRIGLQSFQTTLAVLAKGDLESEYDLDLKSVRWMTRKTDTITNATSKHLTIEAMPTGTSMARALEEGMVDAIFYSRTPWNQSHSTGPIRRLFANPQEEERRYFAKHGYWPIMHVIALKKASVAKDPSLPIKLMHAFESAHKISAAYLDDPGASQLAWTKYAREEEARLLGTNLWPLGIAANRSNLERFIDYSFEQGIIDKRISIEDMFHLSIHGA